MLGCIDRVYAVPRSLFEHESASASFEGVILARVAIERGLEKGSGGPPGRAGTLRDWDALTYRTEPGTLPGEHVTVPLGRSDTPTRGIVVEVGGPELAGGLAPDAIKPILARTGARLPPSLVSLGCWMAEYYVCPLGMALSAVVPAAVKARVGVRTIHELAPSHPAPDPAGLPPKALEAWATIQALPRGAFPMPARALADAIGTPTLREVNRLLRHGMLTPVDREIVRSRQAPPELLRAGPPPTPPVLTASQAEVVEGVTRSLGTFSTHLLMGVTASGKTEVYLRLIDRVLGAGGTAIVLVPEISLTPQTGARFSARFRAEGVAVLHSGLTAAQRHGEWRRAATGGARVVVGARSAVFAPLEHLGLIVVDEEHDTSYKQDQLPRYNARDVAIVRGRTEGCPVLLGSATPSLESWANAAGPHARYGLWRLPERVGAAAMPRIEVVDMVAVQRALPRGTRPDKMPSLSPVLHRALREALTRGEQAIILLNRRGYAHYLCCASSRCGWTLDCDHCDARLVLHTGRNLPRGSVVRCHHCLGEQVIPDRCPACQGKLIAMGVGTQRVEEELAGEFSAERVGEKNALVVGRTLVRVDSDSMRSGRDYFETLHRFAEGEVRVLLGTQMIAKGLDFPNVSLVGVLCADAALSMPDFRATERTFQLVSQVAGRAGRGTTPGLVVVQAFEPEAPAIRAAAEHRYEAFANAELAARRDAGLPPATRMARIVCRDRDFERSRTAATELAESLRASGVAGVEVLGPSPCTIARIADHFRFEVLLLAPAARPVQQAMGALRARGLLKSDAHTAIDVDPVALL